MLNLIHGGYSSVLTKNPTYLQMISINVNRAAFNLPLRHFISF